MSIDPNFLQFLRDQRIFDSIIEIPTRGICAIGPLIFGAALYHDLNWEGRRLYYQYPSLWEARIGLHQWDGQGHPPGPWVRYYGKGGEYSNPSLKK